MVSNNFLNAITVDPSFNDFKAYLEIHHYIRIIVKQGNVLNKVKPHK